MEHLGHLKKINFLYAKVSAVLGVTAIIGMGYLLAAGSTAGDAVFTWIMIGSLALVVVFVGLSVALSIVAGRLVEQGRGRVLQTILAVLSVGSNPPLGTAYAIYAFWVCWFHPESRRHFDEGTPAPAVAEPDQRAARVYRIVRTIMLVSAVFFVLLSLASFGGVGYLISWGGQENRVVISGDRIEITGMYGETFSRSELEAVELRDSLPRITMRTNGYALGGTLKGWFTTQDLGRVKLFVHGSTAPYLYLRRSDHWVIIGYTDPARTRELYDQLRAGAAPSPRELQPSGPEAAP